MSAIAEAPKVRSGQRVNEIDLLRFVAALLVVVFHYAFRGYAADGLTALPYPELASAAKYGYLDVQLFFLITYWSGKFIFLFGKNCQFIFL